MLASRSGLHCRGRARVDVLPADRGEVGKQRVWDNFIGATQVVERTAEVHGVPECNTGSDEREPTRPILLGLGSTIAQPAEAMKVDGARKGVARLTLIELRGSLPPESRQPNQSSIDSVRSIRPISRRASAKPSWRGQAPMRLRRSEALAAPVLIEVTKRKTSFL